MRTGSPLHPSIISLGVGLPRQLDHALRNVDADDIEAAFFQKSCRTSGATTEIECFSSGNMLRDDCGQVAVT